eukprot:COSAG02_NODE_43085_length_378_cov_0.878136_1_plen_59_part_10
MYAAEFMVWQVKLTWILIAPDPGVTAAELAAALPSIEDIIVLAKGGFGVSVPHMSMMWH